MDGGLYAECRLIDPEYHGLAAATSQRREPEFVRASAAAMPGHGPERPRRAGHRRERLLADPRAKRGARPAPHRPAASGNAYGPGQAQQNQDGSPGHHPTAEPVL